jgi:hypothetical protein
MMTTVSFSLKHVPSQRDECCSVCGARFVAAEDSGSRVFSMLWSEQEPFSVLMCGGCHSKWSHGKTVLVQRSVTEDSKPLRA